LIPLIVATPQSCRHDRRDPSATQQTDIAALGFLSL
jgi:hypothetical protein